MPQNLTGIGIRHKHLQEFIQQTPELGWVEIHSENFSSLGGLDFETLLHIREDYDVSMHGIGMSLGSSDGIDQNHLQQVNQLMNKIGPFLISEHLSWNTIDNKFLPDLLPAPFNNESLKIFADNISIVQDYLGQQMLIENPSTYFEYNNSSYTEAEFLNLLCNKTGAGILLDVNNTYISGLNNGWSPEKYINDLDPKLIKEIHLSGHSVKEFSPGNNLYIDSHDSKVCDEVWVLYKRALNIFGKVPTLIEWDANLPELSVLLAESAKIQTCIDKLNEEIHV